MSDRDELGEVRIAIGAGGPASAFQLRYDAALAARPHALTESWNALCIHQKLMNACLNGETAEAERLIAEGHRSIGRMRLGGLRCTVRPRMATRSS